MLREEAVTSGPDMGLASDRESPDDQQEAEQPWAMPSHAGG